VPTTTPAPVTLPPIEIPPDIGPGSTLVVAVKLNLTFSDVSSELLQVSQHPDKAGGEISSNHLGFHLFISEWRLEGYS
jgi:hypothetical protein